MTTNLNFGQALEALKQGSKISRIGWNGKGMYLSMASGQIACEDVELSDEDAAATLADAGSAITHIDGVPISLFNGNTSTEANVLPHIYMRTATGNIVNGWLASQTDMLAEDWCIL